MLQPSQRSGQGLSSEMHSMSLLGRSSNSHLRRAYLGRTATVTSTLGAGTQKLPLQELTLDSTGWCFQSTSQHALLQTLGCMLGCRGEMAWSPFCSSV